MIVGFHREFDYERMRIAADAVRRGARLIATNDDATYPTPDGPIPGGGAILASIATATGRHPVVAGKPYAPMAGGGADARRRPRARPAARWSATAPAPRCVRGDARVRFALVRTGVTLPGDEVGVPVASTPPTSRVVDASRRGPPG